jgi:triacylglycerol esterase/lipase EstA (alpha/beta hydrolase family)
MAQQSQNPVVIIEGVGFWDSLYNETKDVLSTKIPSEKIFILPINALDWIGFPPSPERSTNRVMKVLDTTLKEVQAKYPDEPINIVAHSGGGTVAMIYLLGKPYQGDSYDQSYKINKLITLGTPFHSLETYGKMKSDFIFEHLDKSFFEKVPVVSVTSDAWEGKLGGKMSNIVSYYFYESVSGKGDLFGDGIVSVDSCKLDGAENVVLEGIEHLPTPMTPWYGAKIGVEQWMDHLD